MFRYVRVQYKLLTEQLGTCTEASIYHEHVLKKAQKEIKKANRLSKKVTKAYEKFAGSDEILEIKEIAELKGIIRSYQECLGKKDKLPDDVEELLAYSKECEEEFDSMVSEGQAQKATIFMKDEKGWPMVSTHMFLGNLKENAKIIANNDTSAKENKIFKSKVSVQEMLSLDIKPVSPFVKPSCDIIRKEDGSPDILERPIRFDRMGRTETAIALSEQLPAGTEYSVDFRIRANSPFAERNFQKMKDLLNCGKNLGIGQWRGSGGKGAFMFKFEEIKESDISMPKEYEGWQ
jgi:hypothetical protein